MTKMNGKSTVYAKVTFKRLAEAQNAYVYHYHCDKCLFDNRMLKIFINKVKKTISFCGVNA